MISIPLNCDYGCIRVGVERGQSVPDDNGWVRWEQGIQILQVVREVRDNANVFNVLSRGIGKAVKETQQNHPIEMFVKLFESVIKGTLLLFQ